MKIGNFDITANRAIVALAVLVQLQGGIGHGAVSLTNMVPAGWIDSIVAWNNFLAYVGTAIMGAVALPGAINGRQLVPSVPTVVKVLIAAFALSLFLPIYSARAQGGTPLPRPRQSTVTAPISGNALLCDPLNLLPGCKENNDAIAVGVTKTTDGQVTCNFNIFANLNPKNLQATIRACVSDANSNIEPDVGSALASAKIYSGSGDQTAIQCLDPAHAIVVAAIEKPAVDAVPAQAATATAPAVAAVAAVPAYKPGLITIFQKFREFVLAGGPTACQNWVNGTINGAVAPAAGALVGAVAAGAAL